MELYLHKYVDHRILIKAICQKLINCEQGSWFSEQSSKIFLSCQLCDVYYETLY